MELLLGCGNNREKKIHNGAEGWTELVTLDIDPGVGPDVTFDLASLHSGGHLPFPDGAFTEIHAYEVLEHYGRPGDWMGFFAEWTEYHRVLAPGAHFIGTLPRHDSLWAWGDPGHCRILNRGTFTFLSQREYERQVGVSPMTDYRKWWKGDFTLVHWTNLSDDTAGFVLQRGP